MGIGVHVVDCANSMSATGVRVQMERHGPAGWVYVASGITGRHGHVVEWAAGPAERPSWLVTGVYRATIDLDSYYAGLGAESFYREVAITFSVGGPGAVPTIRVAVAPGGLSAYLERERS
jgi:5-hydroxyisourate hydrolase